MEQDILERKAEKEVVRALARNAEMRRRLNRRFLVFAVLVEEILETVYLSLCYRG